MYCSECGTKNKEDSLFCEECGNNLKKKVKEHKERKKVEKKTKIVIGIVISIIVIIGIFFSILSYMTSPKRIAEQYMKAIANNNTDKLYSYLELDGDKTFISKDIYKELLKENSVIENYHITDIDYGNLTASVTFSYIEKNKSIEKIMRISLVKQKQKTFLFFDNWKISSSELNDKIVENIKIVVPKNAKVNYAGVEVTENYLDKENSTDTTDIYILKQVFSSKTKVIVELENGYKIEDEFTPTNYKTTYTAKVSLSTLTKEEQEQIMNTIQNDLTILYNGAIKNNSFDELRNLNLDIENQETIENKYNVLKIALKKAYNTLTKIEFTKITLSSVKLDDNGNLEFRFKANYQYSIQYVDNDLTQTKESQSYTYMNLSYSVKDKTYYLVDANNLEDYFSRN